MESLRKKSNYGHFQPKVEYDAYFPLNFHHWTGFCNQNHKIPRILEFFGKIFAFLRRDSKDYKKFWILGILWFWLQNPVQWWKLSGKNASYSNFGWKCPYFAFLRRDSIDSKKSRILGILWFWLQNPVQRWKLSGKNAPYSNFGWKYP